MVKSTKNVLQDCVFPLISRISSTRAGLRVSIHIQNLLYTCRIACFHSYPESPLHVQDCVLPLISRISSTHAGLRVSTHIQNLLYTCRIACYHSYPESPLHMQDCVFPLISRISSTHFSSIPLERVAVTHLSANRLGKWARLTQIKPYFT